MSGELYERHKEFDYLVNECFTSKELNYLKTVFPDLASDNNHSITGVELDLADSKYDLSLNKKIREHTQLCVNFFSLRKKTIDLYKSKEKANSYKVDKLAREKSIENFLQNTEEVANSLLSILNKTKKISKPWGHHFMVQSLFAEADMRIVELFNKHSDELIKDFNHNLRFLTK